MAEEGSIRQTIGDLRRTRQQAPASQPAKPVYTPTRRVIPPNPTAPSQIGARHAADVASSTRDRLLRARGGTINLPTINAVAFNAQNQADNAYQEGLGTSDAYQEGVGEGGETSATPVMPTFEQTYGAENEEEEAFAEQQEGMRRTQEQFLPGSTGLPEVEFENPEVERTDRIRRGAAPEDEQALAAAFQADQARRFIEAAEAAAQEEELEQEEEEEPSSVAAKAESTKRAIAIGVDVFNGVVGIFTAETVIIGAAEFGAMLFGMNTRLLVWALKIRPGSLVRTVEPPAQYPFEVFAIIVADILVVIILFVFTCILLAMLYFVFSFVASVPGMPSLPGLPSLTPPHPPST